MGGHGYPYELEHVVSTQATISEGEIIGPVAEGFRANYYVTGGELLGSKLKGKIRPVGADWLTVRTDGVGILDVRVMYETDDGAVIYACYYGTTNLGPDGYKNLFEGAPSPPGSLDLRICPRFQTAHADYQWMNTGFFIGIGKAYTDKHEVGYDIYQVG